MKNARYIISQETLSQQYFEEIFQQPYIPEHFLKPIKIAGDRLVFKSGKFGQFQVCFIQQIVDAKEEFKNVFTFPGVKQAFSALDQLRNKDLFKTSRNYPFEYSIDGNIVTSGAELIPELLKEFVGIVYICHMEDQLSPFVKNGKFWKLREKYVILVVGCSQLTVTLLFVQQMDYFQARFGEIVE